MKWANERANDGWLTSKMHGMMRRETVEKECTVHYTIQYIAYRINTHIIYMDEIKCCLLGLVFLFLQTFSFTSSGRQNVNNSSMKHLTSVHKNYKLLR